MTDYETRRTNVPPVLAIEDGRLVIKLIDGPLTLIAEVGDGRYFFSQVVAKLVDPALDVMAQLNDLQRKRNDNTPTHPMISPGWPLASPND